MKTNKDGLTFVNFKTYHKVTVFETMWSWHNDRGVGNWKRIESIVKKKKFTVNWFSTRSPRIFNIEKSTFLTNCSSTTGYSYAVEWRKTAISCHIQKLIPYGYRPQTVQNCKTLRRNHNRRQTCTFGLGNGFLHITLKAQE